MVPTNSDSKVVMKILQSLDDIKYDDISSIRNWGISTFWNQQISLIDEIGEI